MLLPPKIAAGVADGTVTLAFRRWSGPRVKVGSRFLTSAGVVEVTSVDPVTDDGGHAGRRRGGGRAIPGRGAQAHEGRI